MLTNSCDWNFEEEQNSFARTGILKTGKQIKDLFNQHCDSWDWNFENFENNFDLVEVELFWLLSAKDFFSWSTCKSKKWKQVQSILGFILCWTQEIKLHLSYILIVYCLIFRCDSTS